jgi:hypothetical protein
MSKNVSQTKKDSGNAGKKSPDSKHPRRVKAGTGGNDDDSVDSRGNLRDFIVYTSDEDEELDESPRRRSRRIKKALKKEEESNPKTTPKPVLDSITQLSKQSPTSSKKIKTMSAENGTPNTIVEPKPVKRLGGLLKKKTVIESDSDSSESDSMEVEDEDEDDYDDEDEDDSDYTEETEDDYFEDDENMEKKPAKNATLSISFGAIGEGPSDRHIPKRHNLKKETPLVRKFVKLVTAPVEQEGIDMQIDQFKALDAEKQAQLVGALEKPAAPQENMMFKILTMKVDPVTQAMILSKYHALQDMDPGSGEYYKHRAWLEKLVSVPLGIYKEMPVSLEAGMDKCGGFMAKAMECLSTAIYGQQESKLQILQFIASKIANPTARGLSLLLIGPPGIGKTSLIKNGIAKALDWPFQFVSLGGDSDATTYTGHQLVYEGSHSGKIANSLIAAKSMSMVLMFDELDKISSTAKGEEVQNLLIHMTDSVQNADFEDKYLAGVPLDLSRTMFVFSGNDISKIDKVLLDRMIVIRLKGYDKKEKLVIAENYLLPVALKEVNLVEKVAISREILEHIITEYAGDEAGVRELKRCIEQITQKINMLRIFNTKDLPFHIPEFQLPFVVKKTHVDLFLKRKDEQMDVSARAMYT